MNKYYNPKQMKNAEQVTVTIMTKGYGKCYKEYKEVIDFLENKIKIIDKAIEYIDNREWADCEECVNQVYDILRGEDNESNRFNKRR